MLPNDGFLSSEIEATTVDPWWWVFAYIWSECVINRLCLSNLSVWIG